MPLMTQVEYAKRAKVTPQYVNKRVQDGTIRKVGRLIDSRQADMALKQTRQRALARRTAADRAQRSSARAKAPAAKPRAHRSPAPKLPKGSLTEARTLRERAQAELVRLDLEERRGTLLPKAEVLRAQREANARLKTLLRQLPRNLAAMLARLASPAEIETMLLREIDGVLERVAADPLGDEPAAAEPMPPVPPPQPPATQEAAA